MKETRYIALRHLRVHGANALNGGAAIGFPAMTAFHGFACEAARALADDSAETSAQGFALVVHDARPRFHGKYGTYPTEKRYTPQQRPQRPEHHMTPPADPRPQVDLEITILLEVAAEPQRFAAIAEAPEAARARMPARALGGPLTYTTQPVVAGTSEELLRHGRRDRLVVDRTSELIPLSSEDGDHLDVLLHKLSPDTEPGRWLAPCTIGYVQVSPLVPRTPARGDYSHMHAEPCIGLVEFVRHATARHELEPQHLFWRPVEDPAHDFHGLRGEPCPTSQ